MIFRLKEDNDRFKTPGIGPQPLRDALGDDDLVVKVFKQPGTNESLREIWQPLHFTMDSVCDNNPQTPDIAPWRSHLVLSSKAFALLESELAPFGEFLPGYADGEPVTLFNCMTFGEEDKSQTTIEYIDGDPCGLETLAFVEADIKDKPVFKSRMQNGMTLYCTSSFRKLIEEHGLQGLAFDEDLLSPF
ncbi:hypothetical protein QQM79_03695 [Marinobacteraceae bacterium S3BR75-40.1]